MLSSSSIAHHLRNHGAVRGVHAGIPRAAFSAWPAPAPVSRVAALHRITGPRHTPYRRGRGLTQADVVVASSPKKPQQQSDAAKKQGQDVGAEPDMIERMVSFFFPKALSDPAPMGLKRINFEELPDQYCEMDERAAPVPGDERDPLVVAVRPLLARTQLQGRPLKCVYDAEVDGWSPVAFHAKVDGLGAALVVAATSGGAILGGYNPEGWIGLGEDRASNGAFLFTWPEGDTSRAAFKLAKVGGPNLAVLDNPGSGPQFGADGLAIPLRPRGLERTAKSKLGSYYSRMPDGGRSLFGRGDDPKRAELVWLKVYVADAVGVEWRLEGITWKSRVED